MAIEFRAFKTLHPASRERVVNYVKIVSKDFISQDRSNLYISDRSTLTDSDMEAALKAIRTQMRLSFKSGCSIKLGDMGTLKPIIKVNFDETGIIIKGSERVVKVDFIPSASLLRDFADFEFKCIEYVENLDDGFAERLKKFMGLFKDGAFFSSKMYASVMKVSRTTSTSDINKYIAADLVENILSNSKGVYRRTSIIIPDRA